MGFFDKAKKFLGGHGVKVEVTRLERQDPASVRFPIGDSVFKGNVRVTSEEPCTVLKHKFELVLRKQHDDGRQEDVVLGEEVHNESTDIMGHPLKWPYELAANQSADDMFMIMDIDIRQALRNLGYKNPDGAIDNSELKFFFRFVADVKGSPFDPSVESPINVVLG